jgi:Fur family transcriptional regulator, ferric uptake regulator
MEGKCMEMEGPDNREIFAKHGLKNTKHRNLIYDILRNAELPLTTESIYLMLKEVDTSISFSTVYRVLDVFASKGLVVKSGIGEDNRAAFELNRMEHRHHLICVGCRKMIAIEGCPLELFEKSLENKTHFDITAHKLEIFGYCPNCKGKL